MIGGSILDIQEKLEEHIMQLNQMAAMRYVTPFKAEVNGKIGEMALVQETLEKWLRVQGLWTNLVSVFTTGDIVTQMPTVAKKFRGIDKLWLKLMERAADQKNVIKCCKNEMLVSSLPSLQEDLDFCEKQLEEYLEGKRNKFPRFYFVSNPDLLKILSVGSDPHAVQDDFAKLFDAIEMVSFDESDRKMLTEIIAVKGSAQEKIVLVEPVRCEGNIEDWLCKLEAEMQRSVRSECGRGSQEVYGLKTLTDFFLTQISQVALIGLQMLWASKINECLEKSNREKIQELSKKGHEINGIMTELTALCLDESLDRLKRTRVETLVTIMVRQVEIFHEIKGLAQKYLIKDANDFEWVKNTRCSWNPETSQAEVCITDWRTVYSYEFLGAKERLCITPLTDKCYITLAQALSMLYGGAPAGPAGTGKTETVKDLGCTLGIYVVVTNCSDEHKFRDMAKIFKGVCQSGLWGCFDEFNRISLPTLSVVAAQVASITNAKKQGLDRFMFPGEPAKIKLVMTCGYFITMNPGYAGRQELPENLKVLFRNMSMMVPDRRVIIAVKLASQGYQHYQKLALKFHVLYKLCEDQLTKTRHYDFGLRNILSVLRTAGASLREDISADEEMIMCRTLRDMNLSKFIQQDIGPFKSLLDDIFAKLGGVNNITQKVYKDVDAEIKKILKDELLEDRPEWKVKIIQLHETSLVRHGFMLVGAVGCGKTTIFNTLTKARSKVVDKITSTNTLYKIIKMNPKAITSAEMYGVVNPVSGEWLSGVFSELWKRANDKKSKIHQWINCDGPVDAMWIENLNTVLDDNKILTLANNERIPMTDLCKMTFEVENLNNASPATVSRCGIIYVDPTDLGWEPLVTTWVKDRNYDKKTIHPEEGNWCKDMLQKYVKGPELFKTLAREYTYMLPLQECLRITNLMNLLNAILLQYQAKGVAVDKALFEKLWVFCLAWAIAGLFEADEREKFHKWLEARAAPLPAIQTTKIAAEKETIFDYFLDEGDRAWKLWEPVKWDAPKRIKFSQLLIPTTDSTRAEFIIRTIASLPKDKSEIRKEPGQQHTLLVGSPGTAKTSVVIQYANSLDTNTWAFKRINFSYATTPFNYQENIESEIEKKVKTYQPLGGKHMAVFLDDLAMPAENK
jgi:dynein heavy chain